MIQKFCHRMYALIIIRWPWASIIVICTWNLSMEWHTSVESMEVINCWPRWIWFVLVSILFFNFKTFPSTQTNIRKKSRDIFRPTWPGNRASPRSRRTGKYGKSYMTLSMRVDKTHREHTTRSILGRPFLLIKWKNFCKKFLKTKKKNQQITHKKINIVISD